MMTDGGRSPSGSGCQPTASAAKEASSQSGIPNAMVERIARAMFDCYHGYNAETQEMFWRQARYGLMRQAERALVAMREPTDAMIRAAAATPGMEAANVAMTLHQGRGYGFDADAFQTGSPLHQAWRAMIDAALASAIEAQRAETQSGSVHERAVGAAETPEPTPPTQEGPR